MKFKDYIFKICTYIYWIHTFSPRSNNERINWKIQYVFHTLFWLYLPSRIYIWTKRSKKKNYIHLLVLILTLRNCHTYNKKAESTFVTMIVNQDFQEKWYRSINSEGQCKKKKSQTISTGIIGTNSWFILFF